MQFEIEDRQRGGELSETRGALKVRWGRVGVPAKRHMSKTESTRPSDPSCTSLAPVRLPVFFFSRVWITFGLARIHRDPQLPNHKSRTQKQESNVSEMAVAAPKNDGLVHGAQDENQRFAPAL